MNQKIAIFCMSTDKPMLMLAGLVKNVLVVTRIDKLDKPFDVLQQTIPANIQKLRDSGFKVLVDEDTPLFSRGTGASLVSLKTKHHDGRPALVVGIERYRELKRRNRITLPKGVSAGLYDLPSSLMDVEYKDTGEAVYKVNWLDLRTENTVMILCCYATVFNNVASADYINQMNGQSVEDEEHGMFASLFSLITHQSVESANAVSKSLSGKRIDDDTVIL